MDAAAPAPELSGDWVVDEGWRPADMAAVTADQMIGADIRNADGQVIASVDDLILSADGKAEALPPPSAASSASAPRASSSPSTRSRSCRTTPARSPCAPS